MQDYSYKIYWTSRDSWITPQELAEDLEKNGIIELAHLDDGYRELLDIYILGKDIDKCVYLGYEAHPRDSISPLCCEWDEEDESYHCFRYSVAKRVHELIKFFGEREYVTESELRTLGLI